MAGFKPALQCRRMMLEGVHQHAALLAAPAPPPYGLKPACKKAYMHCCRREGHTFQHLLVWAFPQPACGLQFIDVTRVIWKRSVCCS